MYFPVYDYLCAVLCLAFSVVCVVYGLFSVYCFVCCVCCILMFDMDYVLCLCVACCVLCAVFGVLHVIVWALQDDLITFHKNPNC